MEFGWKALNLGPEMGSLQGGGSERRPSVESEIADGPSRVIDSGGGSTKGAMHARVVSAYPSSFSTTICCGLVQANQRKAG